MHMGERLSYYERREEALQDPDVIWSLIGDGMAQAHCQLPHLAGLKTIDTWHNIYKEYVFMGNLSLSIVLSIILKTVPTYKFMKK